MPKLGTETCKDVFKDATERVVNCNSRRALNFSQQNDENLHLTKIVVDKFDFKS